MAAACSFAEEQQENVAFFGEAYKIKKLLTLTAQKIAAAMAEAGEVHRFSVAAQTQEKSACGAKFQLLFEGLVNVCNNRLSMTHSAEKLHMLRLKGAWKEQDRYKEEIRNLSNELYSLRMCMKMRVAAKQRQTLAKEAEIAENVAQCESLLRANSFQSEIRLREAASVSSGNQDELQRELGNAKTLLELLRGEHAAQEKQLRETKKSCEEALLGRIAEYDGEVQQLADEMKATSANHTSELSQFESLTVKFEAQEKQYQAAMRQKATEERQHLDKQVQLFRTRLAARRIQHCWRAYQQRKLEAAKNKKGKKGRKKAKK